MDTSTVNENLRKVLLDTLNAYAVKGLNGENYLTSDMTGNLFTVLSVGNFGEERIVDTSLVVRLIDDLIVIEHDVNDKPLLDALLQAGVPRHSIVLAYTGETTTERA